MSEDRLAVALEEYKGLRAEQVARISSQSTLVAPVVAVLAVAGAWSSDLRAWLPLVVFPLSLAYYSHRFWINHVGEYIRQHLWPEVSGLTGSPLSWERFTEQVMWRVPSARWTVMVAGEAGIPLLMTTFAAMFTLSAKPGLEPSGPLFWLDWAAVAGTILGLPLSAFANKKPVELELKPDAPPRLSGDEAEPMPGATDEPA